MYSKGFCKSLQKSNQCGHPTRCLKTSVKPVSTWSNWSSWSQCDSNCSQNRFQFRTRKCSSTDCVGPDIEKKACDTMKNCIELSEWTDWSPCTAPCGSNQRGLQTRARKCLNKFTNLNSTNCQEHLEEKRFCFTNEKCAAAPKQSEWTDWSKCKINSMASCGNGTKMRMRKCNREQGDLCRSESEMIVERETCALSCVRTDWTNWSNWSACSTNCGQGFMLRKRVCVTGSCQGTAQEFKSCVMDKSCFQIFSNRFKTTNSQNSIFKKGDLTSSLFIHFKTLF